MHRIVEGILVPCNALADVRLAQVYLFLHGIAHWYCSRALALMSNLSAACSQADGVSPLTVEMEIYLCSSRPFLSMLGCLATAFVPPTQFVSMSAAYHLLTAYCFATSNCKVSIADDMSHGHYHALGLTHCICKQICFFKLPQISEIISPF